MYVYTLRTKPSVESDVVDATSKDEGTYGTTFRGSYRTRLRG